MLTEEEQAKMRDAVSEVEAFVLALRRELLGTDGVNLMAAIAVLDTAGTHLTRG